jgi:hypothetical protein
MLFNKHLILSRVKVRDVKTHVSIADQVNVSSSDFCTFSLPTARKRSREKGTVFHGASP